MADKDGRAVLQREYAARCLDIFGERGQRVLDRCRPHSRLLKSSNDFGPARTVCVGAMDQDCVSARLRASARCRGLGGPMRRQRQRERPRKSVDSSLVSFFKIDWLRSQHPDGTTALMVFLTIGLSPRFHDVSHSSHRVAAVMRRFRGPTAAGSRAASAAMTTLHGLRRQLLPGVDTCVAEVTGNALTGWHRVRRYFKCNGKSRTCLGNGCPSY